MQILRTIKVKAMPNLFGLALLCLLCDLAFADVAVDALPTGGQVVAGVDQEIVSGAISGPHVGSAVGGARQGSCRLGHAANV